MSKIPFTKMHALGNDFVLLEEHYFQVPLTVAQIRHIANRRLGIGCDQLIILQKSDQADIAVSFYNADGSKVLACGNGTRCIARYLDKESGIIQTPSFLSKFWKRGDNIAISLKNPTFPPPKLLPKISLEGHAVDLGNPHLVIFAENLDSISLETLGPALQSSEGVNVELAQIVSPSTIKVKVWERGVGITPSCGSGACAVGILSLKLGLVKKSPVSIEMDGGCLQVEWTADSSPLLIGPADYCFKGIVELS